jgi:glutamyl-tRNA synthetase
MDYLKLAELLMPDTQKAKSFWIEKYPPRKLPEGAKVTRTCPSPTGFLHIGALYMGLLNQRIANDSGGKFFIRIEDTDAEREVPGARGLIIKGFKRFGIVADEGLIESVGDVSEDIKNEKGDYGPYIQSARKEIYQSFVKDLLARGLAYPCFLSKTELDLMRKEQEAEKVRPGVYGKYAKWRDAKIEDIASRLQNGETPIIRFRASGNQNNKQRFNDVFLGDLQVPENDEDFVLLKTNGIPTYHLAHVVDDYLMGTNFVIRGEEWLSSLPKHLDLWKAFEINVPEYGHIMPINKQDGSSVRKLSKRKDPEANIQMYVDLGYPEDSVIGYLYRLANPSFDAWWQSEEIVKSRTVSVRDFAFNIEELKRGGRGPLVDMKKLDDISGDIISKMTSGKVAEEMLIWADQYNPEFAKVAKTNLEYFTSILSIERDTENPRKDILNWSTGIKTVDYFFDEYFNASSAKEIIGSDLDSENIKAVLELICTELHNDNYYTETSLDSWLAQIKSMAVKLGFAEDRKSYKENPANFKGDFASFTKIIRAGITGRDRTPNLFYVLKVLGKDRVVSRLKKVQEMI